jgi:hypothetical protein
MRGTFRKRSFRFRFSRFSCSIYGVRHTAAINAIKFAGQQAVVLFSKGLLRGPHIFPIRSSPAIPYARARDGRETGDIRRTRTDIAFYGVAQLY